MKCIKLILSLLTNNIIILNLASVMVTRGPSVFQMERTILYIDISVLSPSSFRLGCYIWQTQILTLGVDR